MSVLRKFLQEWRLVAVLSTIAVFLIACTTTIFGPTDSTGDAPAAPIEAAAAEDPVEETSAEEGTTAEMSTEAVAPEAESASVEAMPEQAEAAVEAEEAPAEVAAEPALTIEQMRILQSLESSGPPPELTNEIWFNSEPLQLADLRGQVVIVEFWTYGCINCQHVLPELKAWHEKYADDGLTIIGVHTPEFTFEKDLNNVQQALTNYGITYPVAIDNDKVTWRAYNNRYWPAMYFIDKAGNVRHLKIGEGRMAEAEKVLQALLAEPL